MGGDPSAMALASAVPAPSRRAGRSDYRLATGVTSVSLPRSSLADEIGIRMTLGADEPSVIRMILRQALLPAGIGCLAGTGMAAAAAQILQWGVRGAPAIDPVAFGGAMTLMIAVMIMASLLPARRSQLAASW